MRLRTPIVALLVASLASACALQTRIPDGAVATTELRVRVGDEVRLVTTDRERLSFRVEEVQSDRFVGITVEPYGKVTQAAGMPVVVPYDRIALIETAKLDVAGAAASAGKAVVFTVAFGTLLLTGVPVVVLP